MSDGYLAPDRADPVGNLLGDLSQVGPAEVAARLRETASEVGISDLRLLLADLQERVLVVWPENGQDPLSIDSTLAGRAFQRGQPVKGEEGAWWFPLGDGSQRLGALGLRSHGDDETVRREGIRLAALAGLLLVSRSAYSDTILAACRLRQPTIAAELRWSAMPPRSMATAQVTIAGVLEPAYDIAGDSFDYALNDDRLHLAVFDAMGHGLTASRLANLAVASYRQSRRAGLDLLQTYRAMDEVILEAFGEEVFVTGHFAELELSSGNLSVLNAGHPHALMIRAGSAHPLPFPPATPVGVGFAHAEIGRTTLEPGDAVLIHSDGISEAHAAGGDIFGVERIGDLAVRALASGETIPETVRRLIGSVMEHRGTDLEDDATLLMFRYHPSH